MHRKIFAFTWVGRKIFLFQEYSHKRLLLLIKPLPSCKNPADKIDQPQATKWRCYLAQIRRCQQWSKLLYPCWTTTMKRNLDLYSIVRVWFDAMFPFLWWSLSVPRSIILAVMSGYLQFLWAVFICLEVRYSWVTLTNSYPRKILNISHSDIEIPVLVNPSTIKRQIIFASDYG